MKELFIIGCYFCAVVPSGWAQDVAPAAPSTAEEVPAKTKTKLSRRVTALREVAVAAAIGGGILGGAALVACIIADDGICVVILPPAGAVVGGLVGGLVGLYRGRPTRTGKKPRTDFWQLSTTLMAAYGARSLSRPAAFQMADSKRIFFDSGLTSFAFEIFRPKHVEPTPLKRRILALGGILAGGLMVRVSEPTIRELSPLLYVGGAYLGDSLGALLD